MKKIALVLSGGGFKGAFQIGALQYLKENWSAINSETPEMKFDIVTGVSVGSLNGLLVASNKFDQLVDFWKKVAANGVEEIYNSDFIDTKSNSDELKLKLNFQKIKQQLIPNVNFDNISIWRKLGLIFSRKKRETFLKELLVVAEADIKTNFRNFKSIANNSPLKTKLETLAKAADIKDCIYKCGYVSLDDGNYYSFKHSDFITDQDFANAILASTAMPIIWTPVEKINTISKGQQNFSVDGGIRNVSPLSDVIGEIVNDSAEDNHLIIIINCSDGKIKTDGYQDKNIAQIALRSLEDVAITEIFNSDIKEFVDKNYILAQVKEDYPMKEIYDYDFENRKQGKPLKYFETIIIQPDEDMGDSLVANKPLIERRIAHGLKKAEQVIQEYLTTKTNFKVAIS